MIIPFNNPASSPSESVALYAPAGHSRTQSTSWSTRSLYTWEEIDAAIEDIRGLLEAADYSDEDLGAIRIALEEALVNALTHGHNNDPSKEVQLRYHLTTDRFFIEIEDQGPGFNPETVPNPLAPENRHRPCGHGLLLMRSYMTWVRFNDSGNCVTMCRKRAGVSEQPRRSVLSEQG